MQYLLLGNPPPQMVLKQCIVFWVCQNFSSCWMLQKMKRGVKNRFLRSWSHDLVLSAPRKMLKRQPVVTIFAVRNRPLFQSKVNTEEERAMSFFGTLVHSLNSNNRDPVRGINVSILDVFFPLVVEMQRTMSDLWCDSAISCPKST